jgi:uncharacterized protein (DUF2345 family)
MASKDLVSGLPATSAQLAGAETHLENVVVNSNTVARQVHIPDDPNAGLYFGEDLSTTPSHAVEYAGNDFRMYGSSTNFKFDKGDDRVFEVAAADRKMTIESVNLKAAEMQNSDLKVNGNANIVISGSNSKLKFPDSDNAGKNWEMYGVEENGNHQLVIRHEGATAKIDSLASPANDDLIGTTAPDALKRYPYPADDSVTLSVEAPPGATEVKLTSGYINGWDPSGALVATDDDGDGVFSVTINRPSEDFNYLWIVDGVTEDASSDFFTADTQAMQDNGLVIKGADYINRVLTVWKGDIRSTFNQADSLEQLATNIASFAYQFKPFAQPDGNGDHSFSWQAGMEYYQEVQPAIIVDDEEVKLLSNVYVDGKLIVTDGTAAAFGDIAEFSKNVYARAALQVDGYLHAKTDARVDGALVSVGGILAQSGIHSGGDINAPSSTVRSVNMEASNSIACNNRFEVNADGQIQIKDSSANVMFEARNSGSIESKDASGNTKFKVDSQDSWQVTAEGKIQANGGASEDELSLDVEHKSKLQKVDTMKLLSVQGNAELKDDKYLQVGGAGGQTDCKIYRDTAALAKFAATGDVCLELSSEKEAQLKCTANSSMDAYFKASPAGMIESNGANTNTVKGGAVVLTSNSGALTADAQTHFKATAGGDYSFLELKDSGTESKLSSKAKLRVESPDGELSLSGSTTLEAYAGQNMTLESTSGLIDIQAHQQGINLKSNYNAIKMMRAGASMPLSVDMLIVDGDGVTIKTDDADTNQKIELTSYGALEATSAAAMTLKSTANDVTLQSETAKTLVKSHAELELSSSNNKILLEAKKEVEGTPGAQLELDDQIRLQSREASHILLKAMGGGQTQVSDGDLKIMSTSGLMFDLDGGIPAISVNSPEYNSLPKGKVFFDTTGILRVKMHDGADE